MGTDLLEFYLDGAGNAQCFYKNHSNITVDWDYNTWEMSETVIFFEFSNLVLSQIDEE